MQPIQFFAARSEDGALLPGATINVYISGTSTLANLYSDENTNVPLANPAYADANAGVFFYTKERKIDVAISRGGYVAPLLREIVTTDPGDVLSSAVSAADRAEVARDAALLSSGIYPNTSEGISNTAFGRYFSVPSPESAEYLILYQNVTGAAVEKKRYPSTALVSLLNDGFSKMGRYGAVYEAVADYTAPSALVATDIGKFVNIATGGLTANASYTTYSFTVTAGEDVYLTAKILGTSTALATFYNAGGGYLGYYLLGPTGTSANAVSYVNERVDVPAGATKLCVSTILPSDAAIMRRRNINGVSARIAAAAATINNSVLPSISQPGSLDVPSLAWTTGYYVAYNTGVITPNAGYGYELHNVTPGETVYLSGAVIGNATALAVFTDSAGAYIGYSNRAPTGATPDIYVNYPVVVPAGATKVALCQPPARHDSNPVGLRRMAIVPGLPDRISALEAGTGAGGFWHGKTIAWFGNSIPAGTTAGGKYPELIASALGATVTNEAVSGSAWRAGVRSKVTGGDTSGLAGSPWQAVLFSLSMNLAEKQSLIDNWATIGPTLTSSPPLTLTPTQQSQALACCYENKLVANHLGANRKDVYVFDNPYNDRAMANDIATAGANSRDRLTYLGAVSFLIDLIMADNPKARIIFMGHFENQLYSSLSVAQEAAAAYWSRPIVRLWEVLGWSQQTITTTGYWSSNLWVASGGPSQTITLTQRWLPDNTHPGNDYSGSAIARIAEVVTPLFFAMR
ncbi:hypothetical protein [Pseudomonas sp. A-R-19]|uniref:hypothetical protein n=1 Tax=Pseudomonas sp. A-R-19 TaxID=2832403 RepID=UPI001CBC754E|nr:hypothetical protein [Pseudomonas sp. A-R-19]